MVAKNTLQESLCSVVIVWEEEVLYQDSASRLWPLLHGLLQINTKGVSVADKVIGRAAAMCLIHFGVKEVYTPLMSQGAFDLLKTHGVAREVETIVPHILNTEGSAPCKMEEMVASFLCPHEGVQVLLGFFRSLGKL